MNIKITEIQIYKNTDANTDFSANIVINDDFIIQRGSNGKLTIPDSNLNYWEKESVQDYAANLNVDEILESLGLHEDDIKEVSDLEKLSNCVSYY